MLYKHSWSFQLKHREMNVCTDWTSWSLSTTRSTESITMVKVPLPFTSCWYLPQIIYYAIIVFFLLLKNQESKIETGHELPNSSKVISVSIEWQMAPSELLCHSYQREIPSFVNYTMFPRLVTLFNEFFWYWDSSYCYCNAFFFLTNFRR